MTKFFCGSVMILQFCLQKVYASLYVCMSFVTCESWNTNGSRVQAFPALLPDFHVYLP